MTKLHQKKLKITQNLTKTLKIHPKITQKYKETMREFTKYKIY